MNVVAIVQARMGSARLPGKVLERIGGRTVVQQVLQRAARVPGITHVVLAVPTGAADDCLAAVGADTGVRVVRGHPTDVLDRYHTAAAEADADVVMRLTADCPLLDPGVSGLVVNRYLEGGVDYVSNIDPPTFPDGYDTEVFSRAALHAAWCEAVDPYEREHVTPFIRRRPNRFAQQNVSGVPDRSQWRLTLDTPADLVRLRRLAALLPDQAGLDAIASLVATDPSLLEEPRDV